MSSRRQYSSCDPCRRLKRKCVYEGTTRRAGLACVRCKELGYNCTFDYVSMRVEQKKKKRYSITSDHNKDQPQSCIGELTDDTDTVDWNSILRHCDRDISLALNDWNDGIDTEFLDLESFGQELEDPARLPSSQPALFDTNSTGNNYALEDRLQSQNFDIGKQLQLPSSWKGSPTKLLNSTFTARSLGTCLYHTYAAMMHGMESRYLEYESNPFGPTHRYTFGLEDAPLTIEHNRSSNENADLGTAHSPIMGTLQNLPALRHPGSMQDIPLGDSMKITFAGLAKFLDHFGHFYGNRLDRRSKVEDERMLIAAQQAFALQWGVTSSHEADKLFPTIQRSKDSSTENTNAFVSSWFKARSLIFNATPGRSFTRVYAMLLFHVSVAPEQAKDVTGELNSILEQSLRQFEELRVMVDAYVKLLNSTSTYRNLLQASVKAFEWFSYIKDTFASLISERDCILEDPFDLSVISLRSTPQSIDILVDADVPLVCQRAVVLIYRVLRQTAKVKQLIRGTEGITCLSQLVDALDIAISFVEDFNDTYDGFHNHCMASFKTLSSTSKLSFGYLVLFWSLGTLTLAEQIERASNTSLQGNNSIEVARSKAKQYETAAISSVIAIAKHVCDTSAESACISIADDSGMKLPFISHHASLAPIVAVLSKSIDHIVQCIIDSETSHDRLSWMLSIKPVLSCLLDMNSTVAGSQSIQSPLNRLFSLHGDLLMECWTIDDFDEVFG